MAEIRINLYEGLFLLNQQSASSDFAGTVEFVREVFRRAEAEVLVLRKWEERKLAYEINGQKLRSIYLLAYFKARGTQIANIERDCNLSEQVLRNLIIRADHVGDAELAVALKDADLSLEVRLRTPRPEEAAKAPVAAVVAASGATGGDDEGDEVPSSIEA